MESLKRKPGRPKKVVEPKSETQFTIAIKIDDATYQGEGVTALEALQAVPHIPLDFISTGTVTVTKGEHAREMLYSTIQLKRLLNPFHQEVLAHILVEGM
jgi:hypothetical protein